MSFEGRVAITFISLEDIQVIQLNSAGLQINQVDLWLGDKRLKTTIKVERFKPVLNIHLKETLEKNATYTLKVQYSGKIQTPSVGAMYYNNYVDEKNIQRCVCIEYVVLILFRTMVSTLLEPSKAHRVFPCFDHPEFKAIFRLTLVHPTKASVFHNTYAENTTEIRLV